MKKLILNSLTLMVLCGIIWSCSEKKTEGFAKVFAKSETKSVSTVGDAADDPSIWYNKANPAESRIIATDKKRGLGVYNLSGEEKSFTAVGRINNCDVQYGLFFGKDSIDIIGGSNRSNNSISIFKYNPLTSSVDSQALIQIPSHSEEIYGFCFYKNPKSGELYTISIGKDGLLEQYRISSFPNRIIADSVWSYKFDSQCEGLVADHENGILFVGEEEFGVWKLDLNNINPEKELVINLTKYTELAADIEGMAIYYSAYGHGYLIISSQGNNSYAIFNRKEPHNYIGSFMISDSKRIDGVSETDGIDVINLNLGKPFVTGLFIAQDGENFTNGIMETQNFKLVPWKDIALSFDPPLIIDNRYQGF